jgi:hypothetical protein
MPYCTKCLKPLDDSKFDKDPRYSDRLTTICKQCKKIRTKNRRYNYTFARRFNSYRGMALRRGISFALSKVDFEALWQKPCVYCGAEITTIGIDRVDNDRGYVQGNVVPCCSDCNWMKGQKSYVEFIERCNAIVFWANAAIARRE